MRLDIAALKAKREALSSQFDKTASDANDLMNNASQSLKRLDTGLKENDRVINEWNSAIGANKE